MDRILIVEDSPTVLHQVKQELVAVGYEVVEATNGEEALHIASDQRPGLVLLDVILPKINGYQVCRKLKAQPGMENIPVIMLTSKSKDSDRHWGMEQGADAYLTKPVETQELLALLAEFLPLA
jgi:twitching motility two-component system response regulator PilH